MMYCCCSALPKYSDVFEINLGFFFSLILLWLMSSVKRFRLSYVRKA